MELGGKWDVLRHRLALTGAVFRTEVSDSWEYGDDEVSPVRALPSKRVKGAELGVQGNLTEQWSVYGGMSRLMSKQTKGANRGSEAKSVPDLTFNLWTSYEAMRGLVLSYGAQHVAKRRYSDNAWVGGLNNNSSTVAGPAGRAPTYVFDTEKAPSYWVQSFAARYRVSARLALNLNVQNLANKFYWARIGSSLDGFQLYGVPGAGRSRGQWRSACSRWCCRPCGATSCSFRPRIAPPMFNRYDGQHGDYLDDHVDVALRFLPDGERVRTDMSCILFLSDPQEYEGGELVLQDTWRAEAIKLAAGDLLLYTGDRIHRVNPVTRGCRLASFFWLESMVRSDEQRRLLFQMDRDLMRLRAEAQGAPSPAVLGLTGAYHNLLRMWAEG